MKKNTYKAIFDSLYNEATDEVDFLILVHDLIPQLIKVQDNNDGTRVVGLLALPGEIQKAALQAAIASENYEAAAELVKKI